MHSSADWLGRLVFETVYSVLSGTLNSILVLYQFYFVM